MSEKLKEVIKESKTVGMDERQNVENEGLETDGTLASDPKDPPVLLRGLNPTVFRKIQDFTKALKRVFKKAQKTSDKVRDRLPSADLPEVKSTVPSQQQVKKVDATNENSASDSVQAVSPFTKPSKSKVNTQKIKKVIFIIVIVIVVGVVGYVAYKYVTDGENGLGGGIWNSGPTPSLQPVISVEESIYAKDNEILQLEEDIRTLDAELRWVVLKESTLSPPALDFKVTF